MSNALRRIEVRFLASDGDWGIVEVEASMLLMLLLDRLAKLFCTEEDALDPDSKTGEEIVKIRQFTR